MMIEKRGIRNGCPCIIMKYPHQSASTAPLSSHPNAVPSHTSPQALRAQPEHRFPEDMHVYTGRTRCRPRGASHLLTRRFAWKASWFARTCNRCNTREGRGCSARLDIRRSSTCMLYRELPSLNSLQYPSEPCVLPP